MKKKILLLFSLVILCIPLIYGSTPYFWTTNSIWCYKGEEMITGADVTASIGQFSLRFTNNLELRDVDGQSLDKKNITQGFQFRFNFNVVVHKYGWNNEVCSEQEPVSTLLFNSEQTYDKKAGVYVYGTDINGEKLIREFHNVMSGADLMFTTDEYNSIRRCTDIRYEVRQETDYTSAEISYPVRLIENFSIQSVKAVDEYDQDHTTVSYDYTDNYENKNITKTKSESLSLTGGEFDSKITGAAVTGGSTTNNTLNIGNTGFGVISITECNLSSMAFSLSNVDFGCQVIKSIILKDASGNIKNTISPADYTTVGSNQINLSLSNIIGIADNDKLIISLSNECTMINPEMDYTIILSTEGRDKDNFYVNKILFPDTKNKVPIGITQKNGTAWCDNSSAYFFNVSGPNGYTNINFNNAPADGSGAFSVAKGQSAITGTANYYKCFTGVNIPVPTTHMPKTPAISDLEYCDGTNFSLPINNPTDYTTETFRLLLNGAEKVGWQGTKNFGGINLGSVGTASAVVQATNGECSISSNTATIKSAIQPIALAFNGSLSYYTEQVNTTIVQTASQTGVTYNIYKDGSATAQDTWIGIKAQTLTKGSYKITATNADASCSAETNLVILEKDLNIGTAWTTSTLSFCQLDGTKDLNSFVSFNGTSSVTFSSTAGLSLSGSIVNLGASSPDTYVITCTAIKDGVTKVFTKNFTVLVKANDISIALLNSTDFSCNTDNPQLQVTTDYPSYFYTWYKGATAQSGTSRTNTIALTKAEGSQNFTAVATAPNGCLSSISNVLTLEKKNLTADIDFSTGTKTFCQSIAGTANIFDDLTGSDRITISLEQSGWTYNVTTSSSDMILINRNQIDLERSKAGTYTVTMGYSQNGCTKTITKQYTIKQMPTAITVTLDNASTVECDLTNPNAQVHADNSAYTYNWTKNGVAVIGNTQAISIPVSKADGLTSISAVPVLNSCLGLPSNTVTLTKRFVQADVTFSTGVTQYCQITGGAIDIFTELSGTDKIAVVNSQSGFSWSLSPSGTGLVMTGSSINLETSQAGTYTVTMTINNNGCSKVITKDVFIRVRPADFTISQTNPVDFACNTSDAALAASVTSYTYNWYKGGANAGSGTTINIPTTKGDVSNASRTVYAIGTAANGCQTNPSANLILPLKTFLEADISISSGTATFCQSPVAAKTDIFDFLSGTDKLAVTTKQHYDWSITGGGLVLASTHEIDLFNSTAGTYTVSFTYQNDGGCAKTLTKTVVINSRPNSVAVTLQNASTIECDLTNPNALVQADNSGYTYNWYKKGTLLSGNTQSMSIPVSKADGLTSIYAIPFLGTCVGLPSNTVTLTKRYVEADLAFAGAGEYCQTVGTTLDMKTLLSGSDKDKVLNSQSGYTWDLGYSSTGMLFSDTQNSIINLEKSFATTYTSSLNIHKDGCSKTLTKDVKIKPRPITIDITLQNSQDIACNPADAQFKAASVTSYTYNWYKGATLLGETSANLLLPISKADGLTNVYAIPVLDGCTGVKTNTISVQKNFVETDLIFSTGTVSYCQYPATKLDLFTELSGTDKLAIQGKQSGWGWSFTGSTADLVISGSEINLETSQAGTYTVTMVITKDGCTKTITKSVIIKAQPVTTAITLQNASTIECDLTNPNALVKAENSAYSYNWYKKGVLLTDNTQSVSVPVSKADGLTTIYSVPVLNGCVGLKSNEVSVTKRFVEANLTFSANTASYCQYPATKLDLFTELSGTDKVAIQGKQSGFDWSFTGSTSDLVISGSEINLETSKPGSYTVTLVITKDGCSKTITKTVVIKAMPSNVVVTLTNASTIECDLTNPNALVQADNSAYTYNWTKNGTLLTGNTQAMSIPVSKADGLTSISAVPVMNGCAGLQSNTVTLTKRFVVADIAFNTTDISYCQKDNGTVDLFAAHLIGADKDAVQSKKNGFDWSFVAPAALVINNGIIDLQKSASGVYDLSLVISNNGCTKTLTKSVVIKEQPGDIAISLTNNADYTCNADAAQLQASVTSNTYSWYKNGVLISGTGSNTAQITVPVTKSDGTTNFYAVGQSDNSCASRTSNVITVIKHFVEANLVFSSGAVSYCQYPKTTVDLFTELSGTDKLAIQQKQSGWGWSLTGSTSDLVISGSSINLETSAAGTYTVTMIITKDGCSKTITKTVVIKAMPSNVVVTLTNASTIECDLTNPNALVQADNSAYTYNWTKNGTLLTGNTQAMSIPVTKADGLTSISAVPVMNGCAGLQSNAVSLTKRFVEADFGFNNTAITLASKDEAVNLFDYTVGKDKDAIINQAGGFTYKIAFTPVKQTAISSIDGSIVPATGLQSGDTQYLLNVIVSKNGCDLTYSKTAIIKSIPRNISIDFATTQSTQECNSTNYMNVVASDATLVYKWYKNDVLVAGQTTYKAAIEVFKTDGQVKIYAVPSTKDGFDGYKTNILNTSKRYVTADLQLDQTTQTLCSVAGKKINIFDYVRGNDKTAVLAGQYGYAYTTVGDCGTAIVNNQYIDVDNSLADDNLTKTVSLSVSQNGCSITQNKTFIIKRRPSDITIELLSKASNTANSNMYCGGDTLSLHVSSSNNAGVSYNWFKDGQLIGNSKTTSFAYPFNDASGLINLSATAAFENSCQSTASNVIPVQKKDVRFDIALDNSSVAYCPDTKKINLFDYVSGADKNNVMTQSNNCTYEFTASGNNGLAIVSYSFLDLDNSTSSTTPYALTMNVNKEGCTKSFSKNVSIKPRPVTPLIALASNKELRFCGGDGVSFTDKNAVTGTTYKWTVNGSTIDGTSTFKYTTNAADDLTVQTTAYLSSNSCPSKASNILNVSNVIPKVEIKLISTKVTVNDNIQLYIYEPTASKSITLMATRVSDKTISDLPYTRNGNIITLTGILPIGEYAITAVVENALTGYCSQNITVSYTLTVTAATDKQNVSNDVKAQEAAIKTLYDETMAKLKAGEIHAILLPIMTSSSESAKLTVYTTEENESVIIRILDMSGKFISSRTEFLNKGANDFTVPANQKPAVSGIYLVNIEYSRANKKETLKGIIK